jgi:hypothetical protein
VRGSRKEEGDEYRNMGNVSKMRQPGATGQMALLLEDRMTEITRWAVLIIGEIPRLAGGGEMTYIFNNRRSANHYREMVHIGALDNRVVKVTIRVEK